MAISLAPIFYSGATDPVSGPIQRIVYGARTVLGRPVWQAAAYLRPSLVGMGARPHYKIYGDAAGSGTDENKLVACHKAISEALERWACMHLIATDSKLYGMELDASSTGLAAWPGFFTRQARKRAYLEAVERWALATWWEGHLAHQRVSHPNCDLITLNLPWPNIHVVILHSTNKCGRHAYGFAADFALEKAVVHASVELERNVQVLDYVDAQGPNLNAGGVSDVLERRMLYFSGSDGFRLFDARCRTTAAVPSGPPPCLIVDEKIPGSWDRYCRVWRCLFQPVWATNDDRTDIFSF